MVIAFCLLWLTIFVSWLLYYFISITRDASHLVTQLRTVVTKIEGLTQSLHNKLDNGMASFTLLSQAVKEVVAWAIKERATKRTTAKKK